MSASPYFFSSIADDCPRPDFVDSTQLHPRMETPPVWAPLEREVPVEYPPGEWVWWVAVVALAVLASAARTYWITP